MGCKISPRNLTETPMTSARPAMVRVDALRRFPDLMRELGADTQALLARFQLDATILEKPHALISYRTLANLLETAALELDCPDFGMRLAMIQGGSKVLGPLGVAVNNAQTLRESFQYCAEHVHAYSDGTLISLERHRRARDTFMRFEILISGLPYQRQTVEQALLLVQHNVMNLSNGMMRAREFWFAHEPHVSLATYRSNFGCSVKFGQEANGAWFGDSTLDSFVVNRDPQLYELATSFIEQRFPPTEPAIAARARAVIEQCLLRGECSFVNVASALGMHMRTLQRRLRAEGEGFETLLDMVRRDIALRYLRQSSLSFTQITALLGYSETSVLTRSCYRWFSVSPRQLRKDAGEYDAVPALRMAVGA